MTDRPATLAELREAGYTHVSIRDELRANLVAKIRAGERLFPALHGYDTTVIPQVINAILAGHDILLLGERGQAKSRLARSLTDLLDEWIPVISGSETNDDPFAPVSAYGRALVADMGDRVPLAWLHREHRFAEKLATPDTSIADLIGEVDPIKIAEGRYLSNEEIIAFGLIPRSNRGIFNLNELPDLAERIQVGLLNILEERDIQVRGFTAHLPLDVMVIASANPEDYTNRGRIITPLKDRFGSQIRTHYPATIAQELEIVAQEYAPAAIDGVQVSVPPFMASLVAEVSHAARNHPQVSARSGVSVKMTISTYEAIIANAQRRALVVGEGLAVPGVLDLAAIEPAMVGKLEFDTWEANDDARVVDDLLGIAVRAAGAAIANPAWLDALADALIVRDAIRLDPSEPTAAALSRLDLPDEILAQARALTDANDPATVLSAIGFGLELLYRHGRIGRTPDGYTGIG